MLDEKFHEATCDEFGSFALLCPIQETKDLSRNINAFPSRFVFPKTVLRADFTQFIMDLIHDYRSDNELQRRCSRQRRPSLQTHNCTCIEIPRTLSLSLPELVCGSNNPSFVRFLYNLSALARQRDEIVPQA